LADKRLTYYRKIADTELLGTISLSRDHKPIITKDTSRKNSIKLDVTNHNTENGERKRIQISYLLTAPNEIDFNWWFNVLSNVIGAINAGLKVSDDSQVKRSTSTTF